MKKRRALVLKGGTMQGAFIVGALKTLHENLDPDYFEAIFATSVGVFEQAFFAAGQVFFMENTWREYVHGRQLINFLNPLRGRAPLDLDYLVELFQGEKSKLDLLALRNSHYALTAFAMDYKTREVVGLDLKEGNVFEIMRATCAIPYLYPKKVVINGRRYIDTWIAPNDRFHEVLKEKLAVYDEVVAIVNNPEDDAVLGDLPDILIKPTTMHLRSTLDTNRERLLATIEQGKQDALNFINNRSLKPQ